MGKDNIQYINKKEKDVLNRCLGDFLKEITRAQKVCQENNEMMEWARLQEDKTVINKFLNKINYVRLIEGDE